MSTNEIVPAFNVIGKRFCKIDTCNDLKRNIKTQNLVFITICYDRFYNMKPYIQNFLSQ